MSFSPIVPIPDPFSPPVVGPLNPYTVLNPTHRPTSRSGWTQITGENGERSARTKQGNGNRGGFPAGSGFGNGRSMLDRNWVREWMIDYRPDLGLWRLDLWTDLGFWLDQRNPRRCAWVSGWISGQKPTHISVGLLDLRSGRCAFLLWLLFLDFLGDEHGLLGSGSGNRRELGIWVGKCRGLGWDPYDDVDGGRSLGWDPYYDIASFLIW
jgi:hypothetical protein